MTGASLEAWRPRVSIVLPARNEGRTIATTIESLLGQTYPASLTEIIVVDGASDDATARIVREIAAHHPRVRLLDNPRRITPVALNIAIRAATGEVIARMDGHAEARPDYVELGVRLLASSGAWSVGGRMHKVGTTPQERANAAAASSPLGVGDSAHNYATRPQEVETVFLGMWPRHVFEKVGLFDEELVRDQDDEHAYRIRKAGGRIWYDPAMIVRYRPRGSLRAVFRQYREYGSWKVRVFQKHPAAARWRHLVPAAWMGAVVVGSVGSLITPFAVGILALSTIPYALVVTLGALRLSRSDTPARRIASAIVAIHAGYGIGFLEGCVRHAPRWIHQRRGAVPRLAPKADVAS